MLEETGVAGSTQRLMTAWQRNTLEGSPAYQIWKIKASKYIMIESNYNKFNKTINHKSV